MFAYLNKAAKWTRTYLRILNKENLHWSELLQRPLTKWCQSALAETETSFTRPFGQIPSRSGKVAITLINLISFAIINGPNKQYKKGEHH